MQRPIVTIDSAFLWENTPDPVVVVAPDCPRFTVLGATNAYFEVTKTSKQQLEGRPILRAFPESPGTSEENGLARVMGVMERCVATKAPTTLPVQKYDIPVNGNGTFETRYWVGRNVPIFDPNNRDEILCIFQRVQDVTHLQQPHDKKTEEQNASEADIRLDLLCQAEEVRLANEALHRTNEHLKEALHQAEVATRAKEEFSTNMTHEIRCVLDSEKRRPTHFLFRTPLTAMLGFAEALAEEKSLDASTRELVTGIQSSGEHLLQLVNQVLDVSKLESGGLSLVTKPLVPSEVLRNCANFVSLSCREKGLELQTDLSSSCSCEVQADPLRLRQMVLNLLGNAVKFTSKGRITLEANLTSISEANEAQLQVRREG